MVLYAFGFAAFVFSVLPAEVAGPTIRQAFPHFYLFVLATAVIGAGLLSMSDPMSATILGFVAASVLPTRQFLMPAINAATDAGERRRFALLHTLSVIITLAHIAASAYVLARFM
jgi:hypothetical protein